MVSTVSLNRIGGVFSLVISVTQILFLWIYVYDYHTHISDFSIVRKYHGWGDLVQWSCELQMQKFACHKLIRFMNLTRFSTPGMTNFRAIFLVLHTYGQSFKCGISFACVNWVKLESLISDVLFFRHMFRLAMFVGLNFALWLTFAFDEQIKRFYRWSGDCVEKVLSLLVYVLLLRKLSCHRMHFHEFCQFILASCSFDWFQNNMLQHFLYNICIYWWKYFPNGDSRDLNSMLYRLNCKCLGDVWIVFRML